MRSNISLTSRSRPEGRPEARLRAFSLRSAIAGAHLTGGLADTRLGPLPALARDHFQEARQVRRPQLQGNPSTLRDTARTVPDHAARHHHEPGLVEQGYRLDRPR